METFKKKSEHTTVLEIKFLNIPFIKIKSGKSVSGII